MAENDASEERSADGGSQSLPVRDWWAEPDTHLALIVGLANKFEFEMSMRLFVNGGVLSGNLISIASYFERSAESLMGAGDTEGSDPVSRALGASFRDSAETMRADSQQKEEIDTDIRHIHMDQSMFHLPGSEPLLIGLWRGKLTSVSGWAMGSYGSFPDQTLD